MRTWREVTKTAPCEVCGKPDWCGRTGDGATRCMRVADAPPGWRKIKVCPDGGVAFRPTDDPPPQRNGAAQRNGRAAKAPPRTWPTLEAAVADRRPGAHWVYHSAEGEPVGVVMRFDKPGGEKVCVPLRKTIGGWTKKAMRAPRPLYRLPELASVAPDETVFVTEGEKCADALAACGAVATTSAGGSKAAGKADWGALQGRRVVILPDNDDAGERYAEQVARLAKRAGAKSVRVARIADAWSDIPKGGDIAEILDEDGPWSSLDDADIRARIDALAKPIEDDDDDDAPEPAWSPFPTVALPRAAADLVRKGADAMQVDEGMLGPLAMGAMSAAIGNARAVELSSSWREPAILWVVVVAPSGAGKSPSLELVTRSAERRDSDSFRVYEDERREHAAALIEHKRSKSILPPPEPPACERFVTNDTTLEALAAMLAASPRGLLLACDELAAWLGGFTRYSGANGRPSSEAARWLPMHRAGSVKVDRKTSPPLRIERAALNIAGLIQPGVLASALTGVDYDSGLVARLLLAMPPTPVRKWSPGGLSPMSEGAYAAMVGQLYALDVIEDEHGAPEPIALTLDDEAARVWADYYDALNRDMAGADERTRAMLAKLEGGAARMAMVIHLGRVAGGEGVDPDRIDGDSMARGVALAVWFRREAERVYDRLGESEDDAERRALVEWVRSKGPEGATARQLTDSGPRAFRGDRQAAEAALADLAATDGFRWEYQPQTGRGKPKVPRLVADADIRRPSVDALDADADIPPHGPRTEISASASNASSGEADLSASTPEGVSP